jgi:hypothetical protein
MSRRPSPLAARLRRELLQRPGFTRLPVCGACQRQVQPRDFGREHCKAGEAARAQVSAAWEREQWSLTHPNASFSLPAEPMLGGPEADEPFLLEED